MKNVFAGIGFCVSVLWLMGVANVGHFALVYQPNKIEIGCKP